MKFVMDERVKHRLTGLVVIVSIAVIFLPAMMKKSNQRFEENINVSLKLPNKPALPNVAIPVKSAMFQSVKVAHVDISAPPQAPHAPQIAKAESLSIKSAATHVPILAKNVLPVKPVIKANVAVAVEPVLTAKVAPQISSNSVALKKMVYAIQLASFAQQSNAQSLVTRLRHQGYVASYNKFNGRQGEFYKVLVGPLNQRDDAINLQKKLVTNLQLNGFIVKTAVS